MKKNVDGNVVDMVAVESRNITYLGYNEENKVLAVEFLRGPVYVYKEVPKSTYEELLASEALDDYFDKNVKNGFANKRVY